MAKYSADELRALGAKGHAFKNSDGSFSFPIDDEEDLGNAIHAVGRAGASHDAVRRYIIRRAREMGKENMLPDSWSSGGNTDSSSRAAESIADFETKMGAALDTGVHMRTADVDLEVVSVRQGGDGRTVDAYAAIFNTPAPIRDQDGEYEEILDPSCFDRAIGDAKRSSGWGIPVLFNHGLTIHGSPSPEDSMPIGTPLEIKADSKGLFTRTRFHDTPRARDALEAIREGSITAYSFAGKFVRSDPLIPRGGFRPDHAGRLPVVRRMSSTLREYGPATFPAYQGAEIVGVRAEQAAFMLSNMDPAERFRLADLLRNGDTPNLEGEPGDTSSGEPEGTDQHAPPVRRPARSPRAELLANRARFITKYGR